MTINDNSTKSINAAIIDLQNQIKQLQQKIGILSKNQLKEDDIEFPGKVEYADEAGKAKEADHAKTADTADTATKAIQDGNGNVITSTYAKKGEVGVPQVVHFNTSNSAGSYELVRFGFRSAFRCVISGTSRNYAEAKIIDVIASSASVPQSNTLGNITIGPQGNFSFGGGDWSASHMYWNKPLTEENVYYTVVLIPYSEGNVNLVI